MLVSSILSYQFSAYGQNRMETSPSIDYLLLYSQNILLYMLIHYISGCYPPLSDVFLQTRGA